LKLSVIGLGKMGLLHAGIVNSFPDAKITSVCERDLFLSTAAKAFLPKTVTVYRNVGKMVSEQAPDAVVVTTPINTHVPVIKELYQKNKDLSVFVEKPLASSHREAMEACEAVKGSKGVNMVGFQRRYSPTFRRAKELLGEGVVGDPIFFKASMLSSDVLREGSGWRSKRESGGVLLDSAPHLLDALIWFFGEPAAVKATKKQVYSRGVDDYVHAVLSYGSGLQGHLDVCWSLGNYRLPEVVVELYGRNGVLLVCDDYVKVTGNKEPNAGTPLYKQSFNISTPFLLTDPEYALEDAGFLDSVRTRRAPDACFVEAAKVNDLIDRILESAT
jgi:predicted dehydrogenase